jgi:acetolactate synthase-1/3 small subunit
MSKHVLSLLVEDKPGLLTRVAGLFARRGFNIESLAVGTSELEGLSRITMLIKVKTDSTTRSQVLEAVTLFRARVIDVVSDAVIIEVTGDTSKCAAFVKILEPFGIKEMVQSGVLAMGRGSKSMTEKVLK